MTTFLGSKVQIYGVLPSSIVRPPSTPIGSFSSSHLNLTLDTNLTNVINGWQYGNPSVGWTSTTAYQFGAALYSDFDSSTNVDVLHLVFSRASYYTVVIGGITYPRFDWVPWHMTIFPPGYPSSWDPSFRWNGRNVNINFDINQASIINGVSQSYSLTVEIDSVDYPTITRSIGSVVTGAYYYRNTQYTSYISGEPHNAVLPVWNGALGFDPSQIVFFPDAITSVISYGQAALTTDATTSFGTGVKRPAGSSISADFNTIAAPGPILLARLEIESDFTIPEGYIDPTYFSEDYLLTGGIQGNIIYGPSYDFPADSIVDAYATQTFGASASLSTDQTQLTVAGYLITGGALISTDAILSGLGNQTHSGLASPSADFTATFSAGIFKGISNLVLAADLAATFTAGCIYDIGVAYAYDWATDYFSPEQHFVITTDSSIYAAASVEHILEANIFADSDIVGQGGKLLASPSLTLGADGVMTVEPWTLNGGAGIIFRPEAILSAEAATTYSAGRIFRPLAALEINTDWFADSRSRIDAGISIVAEAQFETIPHYIAGGQLSIDADTGVLTQPGFRHYAAADYLADFEVAPVRVKLVSLDEYYIDYVSPELRRWIIPKEVRTIALDPQAIRVIHILPEQTTQYVAQETRIDNTEVGAPYLAGRRIRRETV